MRVPDDLAQLFALPSVGADVLGRGHLDGERLAPSSRLIPYLTVLPMGWSWSLRFCQSVTEAAVCRALGSERLVRDRSAGLVIDGDGSLGGAAYVDNFCVIGSCPDAVNEKLAAISLDLSSLGFAIHEQSPASTEGAFIGLDLKDGHVAVQRRKLWRLRLAVEDLLGRRSCSGHMIEVILGHATWLILCRREALSIFDACYRFAHRHRHEHVRLWGNVRRELQHLVALLPLFVADLRAPWSDSLLCSDASPFGIGVCARSVDPGLVGRLGRCAEKWRYRVEDLVAARAVVDTCLDDVVTVPPEACGFLAIPRDLMDPGDWTCLCSLRHPKRKHITETKGRTLLWAYRHTLQSSRKLGHRVLVLVDNMSLCLGVGKGRSGSRSLGHILRSIAAISLASGSRLVCRWIRSELNVADGPSRLRRPDGTAWEDGRGCLGGSDAARGKGAQSPSADLPPKGPPVADPCSDAESPFGPGQPQLVGAAVSAARDERGLSSAHGQVRRLVCPAARGLDVARWGSTCWCCSTSTSVSGMAIPGTRARRR